jgi:probable HAF family extracellular repeat protein
VIASILDLVEERMFLKGLSIVAVISAAFIVVDASGNQQAELAHRPQTRYHIVDLGTLGGSFAQPGGINNKDEIEGFSNLAGDTQTLAYFRSRSSKITVIPGLGGPNSIAAWAPSISGQVGGFADTSTPDPLGEDYCGFGTHLICNPFVWHNGKTIRLPLLSGNNAEANGFNDEDEVVGKAELNELDPHCAGPNVLSTQAVVWKHGKLERALPNFPGFLQGSGHSINNFGEVVGWSGVCSGPPFVTRATLWIHGKPIDLGTLRQENSQAFDINNRGQIVGFSANSDGSEFRSFLWFAGKMRDLGTLPGDIASQAVGLNDLGDVVGGSFDPEFNERAYLWRNGLMLDLNTLTDGDNSLFLFEAEDLNSLGQIIGVGFDASTGEVHGFLANPIVHDYADGATSTELESTRKTTMGIPEAARKLVQKGLATRRLGRRIPINAE